MRFFIFLLIAFFISTGVCAQQTPVAVSVSLEEVLSQVELPEKALKRVKRMEKLVPGFGQKKKITAVGLAVALGTFGVHRLYLGTRPLVPVVYTLTLGGGLGILPLTDIIAIIATSDLSKYENNDQVVMWIDREN